MGVPSRDDRHLFELLTLEGAQAGLSWNTRDIARLLKDPGIVRNRLKVASAVVAYVDTLLRASSRALVGGTQCFGHRGRR
jgi:3-methyladenine DNA glycosylase Tag